MPRSGEAALGSFVAAAGREFEVAGERRPVVERVLCVGDRRLRLRFVGGELAGLLEPGLAARSGDAEGLIDCEVDAWEESACVDGPVPFPWARADIGPGGLVRGSGNGGASAVHETSWGGLTLTDRRARVLRRVPDCGAVPWWERAAPLRVALFWALAGAGRHVVHAGAVGDDRGAVLLAGARGSGKTTVALAGVDHGLRYLGDDYVLLETGREPTVSAIYRNASVRGASDREPKTILDVAAVRPGAVLGSAPVRAVIVPRITGGRASVRRVTSAEALRAWAPATAVQFPFDGGAVLASLAAVVGQVPCFALDVGDDATELARAVDQGLRRS
jgi:hypothetical protein